MEWKSAVGTKWKQNSASEGWSWFPVVWGGLVRGVSLSTTIGFKATRGRDCPRSRRPPMTSYQSSSAGKWSRKGLYLNTEPSGYTFEIWLQILCTYLDRYRYLFFKEILWKKASYKSFLQTFISNSYRIFRTLKYSVPFVWKNVTNIYGSISMIYTCDPFSKILEKFWLKKGFWWLLCVFFFFFLHLSRCHSGLRWYYIKTRYFFPSIISSYAF